MKREPSLSTREMPLKFRGVDLTVQFEYEPEEFPSSNDETGWPANVDVLKVSVAGVEITEVLDWNAISDMEDMVLDIVREG